MLYKVVVPPLLPNFFQKKGGGLMSGQCSDSHHLDIVAGCVPSGPAGSRLGGKGILSSFLHSFFPYNTTIVVDVEYYIKYCYI